MGSAEGPYILINKELKQKLIKDLGHKIQVKLKPFLYGGAFFV